MSAIARGWKLAAAILKEQRNGHRNLFYDPKGDVYSGEIKSLSLHRTSFYLRPHRKSGEKDPDYRVVHEGESGAVEFGAAWKRESERGRAFLSVVLDDPILPSTLIAALLLNKQGDKAKLMWTRAIKKPTSQPGGAGSRKPRPRAPSP